MTRLDESILMQHATRYAIAGTLRYHRVATGLEGAR